MDDACFVLAVNPALVLVRKWSAVCDNIMLTSYFVLSCLYVMIRPFYSHFCSFSFGTI